METEFLGIKVRKEFINCLMTFPDEKHYVIILLFSLRLQFLEKRRFKEKYNTPIFIFHGLTANLKKKEHLHGKQY